MRFLLWLPPVGFLFGAVVGAVDLGMTGSVLGGLAVGAVTALVCQVAALVLGPFLGAPEERTIGRILRSLILLPVLIVVYHEVYWIVNFVSLAATHNVGVRLEQMIARHADAGAVQTMLAEKRLYQADASVARPQRWLLCHDVVTCARNGQELIDGVTNQQLAVDAALEAHGRALAAQAEQVVDQKLPHTWLLRLLPGEVLRFFLFDQSRLGLRQ